MEFVFAVFGLEVPFVLHNSTCAITQCCEKRKRASSEFRGTELASTREFVIMNHLQSVLLEAPFSFRAEGITEICHMSREELLRSD